MNLERLNYTVDIVFPEAYIDCSEKKEKKKNRKRINEQRKKNQDLLYAGR